MSVAHATHTLMFFDMRICRQPCNPSPCMWLPITVNMCIATWPLASFLGTGICIADASRQHRYTSTKSGYCHISIMCGQQHFPPLRVVLVQHQTPCCQQTKAQFVTGDCCSASSASAAGVAAITLWDITVRLSSTLNSYMASMHERMAHTQP